MTIFSLSVIARYHGRQKPVFLARWQEDEYGTEDWDAFHTLEDAKRWALAAVGRKRGTWTHEHDGIWSLDIEFPRGSG